MKFSGPTGEFEVDAPVAQLVGIGQRRACHRLGIAHVVKLAVLSRQADLDIAQALTVGKLCESENENANLFGATKGSYPAIAAVTIHDAMEGLPRQKIHDLRKQRCASVHRCEPSGKGRRLAIVNSYEEMPKASFEAAPNSTWEGE